MLNFLIPLIQRRRGPAPEPPRFLEGMAPMFNDWQGSIIRYLGGR